MRTASIITACFVCAFANTQFALGQSSSESATVPVNRITEMGVGEITGEIRLQQTTAALELVVVLENFPPGWHAIHVHENPSCGPALENGSMSAGGAGGMHYDPLGTMQMNLERPPKSDVTIGPRDGKAMSEVENPLTGSKGEILFNRSRPNGDLPSVFVEQDGSSEFRILTYRLSLSELRGRSIMLHEFGEVPINPDSPFGGGKRIACGVLQ